LRRYTRKIHFGQRTKLLNKNGVSKRAVYKEGLISFAAVGNEQDSDKACILIRLVNNSPIPYPVTPVAGQVAPEPFDIGVIVRGLAQPVKTAIEPSRQGWLGLFVKLLGLAG
jgi:hypothetical protein